MNKKTKVCRVCLDSNQIWCKSLFHTYKDILLYEFINTITNLSIKLNDGFPDKICKSCYFQLKSAINFKEKCESSNVILRSHSVKTEELPEKSYNGTIKREVTEEKNIKLEDQYDDNLDNSLESEPEQSYVKIEENNEQCFACPVIFNESDQLNEHKSIFKSRAIDLKLECHDCGGIFKSKCKLKVHWNKTHMLPSLVCKHCKRAFKSYKAFHLHRKKKTKSCVIASDENVIIEGVGRSRVFLCKQCNYKSIRVKDMSAHLVIHSGDRPFECNICSKTYTQLSSLQGHQETAHQKYIVEMTCHYCGKFIEGRRKVHRHLRSHSRVDCSVCNKSISKLGFMTHMKRHSGVKSYACENCASTFYTISELCNHKRIVHSKKMYKCDHCDYASIKENCMKNHMSKHSDKNIPCITCGRFFISTEKLAVHQKIHYAEKKFTCPQCNARFYKRDSVRRHIKLKHSLGEVAEKKAPPSIVKTETICVTFEPEGTE